MTDLLSLAWKSLLARKGSVLLTILAVALSVALFLGVNKAREGARDGFDNTISSTDLIVGAPTGQVNLLLYSVFRMGNATAEMSWGAYEDLTARSDIAWTVPISLGDSHRGFRVLGTTTDYFERYKYRKSQSLQIDDGKIFDDLFDAVLGADVARDLGYQIGSPLVLSHGLGQAGLSEHDNRPFRVAGILAKTGTPVDRTVHVSLEAITAIHVGWETGARNPLADGITEETIREFDLTPKTVTAVFVGLSSPTSVLRTRRAINTTKSEPLMAIMPPQALAELWSVTALAERALMAVSVFVVGVGLVSILTSILASLNERRREMSILRASGASPGYIFGLLTLESALIGFFGAVLGIAVIYLILAIAGPMLEQRYGIALVSADLGLSDLWTLVTVTFASFIIGIIPAWTALKRSLADGLSLRI